MRYIALRLLAREATVEAWYIPKRQKAYRGKNNLERPTKGLYLELRKEPSAFPEATRSLSYAINAGPKGEASSLFVLVLFQCRAFKEIKTLF